MLFVTLSHLVEVLDGIPVNVGDLKICMDFVMMDTK